MSQQHPLTLITPVIVHRKGDLFAFLEKLRLGLEHNLHESFENIQTIHFARWLVID